MPEIRPASEATIDEAADRLRHGRVVAFATETVYGLGADTFDPGAIESIYTLKGRPADNPLIAHVRDAAMARAVAADWSPRCDSLAAAHWPGPLTLVVPRRDEVPPAATGQRPTIAVRAPAHAVARALLDAFGGPISAPSANRSGHVSPTTAEHVAHDFAHADDLLIVDGGQCTIGIESTVVDLSGDRPRLLRPGSIGEAALRHDLPDLEVPRLEQQEASPGTASAHYSPTRRAMLLAPARLDAALADLGAPCAVLARQTTIDGLDADPGLAVPMPVAPEAYGHALYAALRRADQGAVECILIEQPPDEPAWGAVLDRLRRAVAKKPR